MTNEPLLVAEDLTVDYSVQGKTLRAVSGVSFSVAPGEMVGLVGESGCGKTAVALSVMGLQAENAKIGGKVLFQRRSLLNLREEEWNALRGKELSMIFQEPMTALNPLMPVGRQVAETAFSHGASREEAKARALESMAQVGLPDPERLYGEYPHRLSGGQRQRVMIAMALIDRPALLIADEPTTALDVTIQAQIMALLRKLNREMGTAVLLISHDLETVRNLCGRVAVMYAGHIVESGPTEQVLSHPGHPYTKGLLSSMPSLENRGRRLRPIPGTVPSLPDRAETGCPFYGRCERRAERCRTGTPPVCRREGHLVRCFEEEV